MDTRTINKKHAGFTLMEVMVAVSVFTIVISVGIGSLLTINKAYRKSQTDRALIDSLTYSLESMSRRIRTAQSWVTTASGNSFNFIDQDGINVTYFLDNEKLYTTISCNGVTSVSCNPGTFEMTSSNVSLGGPFTGSGFWVTFFPQQPTSKKYMQMNLGGTVTNGQVVSSFNFQTGVTNR